MATKIRAGRMDMTAEEAEHAGKVAERVEEMLGILKQVKGTNRKLLAMVGWVAMRPDVDYARLKAVIERNYPSIIPPVDTIASLDQLQALYNKKLAPKNQAFFADDYKEEQLRLSRKAREPQEA